MEQETLSILIKFTIGITILLFILFAGINLFNNKRNQKKKNFVKKSKNLKKSSSARSNALRIKSSSSQKRRSYPGKKSSRYSEKAFDESDNQKNNKEKVVEVSDKLVKTKEKRVLNVFKETILVVDDSSTARQVLEKNLSEKNYKVELAGDGIEALNYIKKNRPDLIITDIEMPRMDGFGLLKSIRGNLSTSGIPVIMITANLDVDVEIGEKNGANGFLRKPYNKNDLTEQVEFLLNFN